MLTKIINTLTTSSSLYETLEISQLGNIKKESQIVSELVAKKFHANVRDTGDMMQFGIGVNSSFQNKDLGEHLLT